MQEAYETLSDPHRRALYDRDLAMGLHFAFSARKVDHRDEVFLQLFGSVLMLGCENFGLVLFLLRIPSDFFWIWGFLQLNCRFGVWDFDFGESVVFLVFKFVIDVAR